MMRPSKALTGKVALVTGDSRGIGKAVALGLAKAGTHVTVNYKTEAAEAAAVYTETERQGGQAVAVQADVSLAAEVQGMVR
jgi:3-oxoacyl-[acyl-carrier protein] reductase